MGRGVERGRRRRRRSCGPLTHSDVARESKAWSPIIPLVSTPTILSRVGYSLPSTSDTLLESHVPKQWS